MEISDDDTNNDETCLKNNEKYVLPKAEIKNYNILIYDRNFYDQSINGSKKYTDWKTWL